MVFYHNAHRCPTKNSGEEKQAVPNIMLQNTFGCVRIAFVIETSIEYGGTGLAEY
jgi:hypothetical protein